MKVTVASVEKVKDRISQKTQRPYKLWSFVDVEGNRFDDIYLGINELPAGMVVELERTEKGWEAQKPAFTPKANPKIFKADPDKMKQDFTLEVARNLSIQRQVAVKGTVDLIVAGKRDYKELQVTFDDLMALLSKHKDELPTDEEVDNLDMDEVPV